MLLHYEKPVDWPVFFLNSLPQILALEPPIILYMRCFFISFILFLSCSFAVFPQNVNGDKSWIVTLKGDTLRGKIEKKLGVAASRRIDLKLADNSAVRSFKPEDILSYFDTEEGFFISKIVMVDYSPIDIGVLREIPEPDLRKEQVFLNEICQGKLKLYTYTKGNGRVLYFVSLDNDTIYPLIDYKYFVFSEDQQDALKGASDSANVVKRKTDHSKPERNHVTVNQARYKGQLNFLMSDWPERSRFIKDLHYTKAELSKLVMSYNLFFNPELKHKKVKSASTSSVSYGITAGLGYGQFNYDKFLHNGNITSVFEPDIPLRAGVTQEIALRKFQGIIKFRNQFGFDWFSTQSTRTYEEVPLIITDKLNFSAFSAVIINGIKFCYPFKKSSVYATIGMTNSYILKSQNLLLRSRLLGQTTTELELEVAPDLIRYHIFYMVGIGADFGKSGFELQYDPPKELTNIAVMDVNHKSLLLNFHYRF
jgi:hypothetical protein